MANSAAIGWDSEFAIGDGGSPEVFTAVAEVTSISPANISRDTVDATHIRPRRGANMWWALTNLAKYR